MQDFANVKMEMTEEPTVSFDPVDDLPPKSDPPSDVVNNTDAHDLSPVKEGIFGDRYVDFVEPLKVSVEFRFQGASTNSNG
jgi:hypothetical protein